MTTISRTHLVEVDPSWVGFGGVQGGLVVAAAVATAAPLADGELLAVTTHFLGPSQPGRLTFDAVPVTPGRGTSYLVHDRAGASVSMVRFSRAARGELTFASPAAPGVGVAGLRSDGPGEGAPPVTRHFEFRVFGPSRPLGGGADPSLDAWVRLIGDMPPGWSFTPVEVAAILLDSLPPGLYSTLRAPVPVPTVEMTAHVAPAQFGVRDWLRVHQHTVWATATHCVDETTVHTEAGHLVAQARQARRILAGRGAVGQIRGGDA